MSAHTPTPGPWHTIGMFDWNTEGTVRRYESLLVGGSHGGIASMLLHSDRQKRTAEANARLIAAAPDMLAALQDIIGFAEHRLSQMERRRGVKAATDSIRQSVENARAAIAKAEGRAS